MVASGESRDVPRLSRYTGKVSLHGSTVILGPAPGGQIAGGAVAHIGHGIVAEGFALC